MSMELSLIESISVVLSPLVSTLLPLDLVYDGLLHRRFDVTLL